MIEFPKHLTLTLLHDDHKNYYMTVQDAIDDKDYDIKDWISSSQLKKSLENDSVWSLQIYPRTLIGSYRYLAYDLDELLKFVMERHGNGQ